MCVFARCCACVCVCVISLGDIRVTPAARDCLVPRLLFLDVVGICFLLPYSDGKRETDGEKMRTVILVAVQSSSSSKGKIVTCRVMIGW